VRDFATTVKKSVMSMEQCMQGYRMAQLMKGLGIDDEARIRVILRIAIAAASA
jgi:hypothetical protein